MTTIVIVTHVVPWPGSHGNEVRVQRLVAWLRSRGYRVTLVLAAPPLDPSRHKLVASNVDRLVMLEGSRATNFTERLLGRVARLRERVAAAAVAGSRGGGLSRLARQLCPPGAAGTVATLARAEHARAVIAVYAALAPALASLDPGVLRIIDTNEVFSMPRVDAADNPVRASRAEERRALLAADIVVAIQSVEGAYLRQLVPERRVVVAGIDVPRGGGTAAPSSAGSVCGIVGSDNVFNAEGVRGFLASGWPVVRARVADARLLVAGKICEVMGAAPAPGVERLGWVANVPGFYASVAVAVNPVLRGTGLKVKSVEAIANGRPLVTSSAGLEGIDAPPQAPWLRADDWPAMGEAIAGLLADPAGCDRLGLAALAYAEEHFAPDAVYRELGEVLATARRS